MDAQVEPLDDLISLVVPAAAPYLRIARIGAATIALRRGFSFQETSDLRLAMDEALIMLLGRRDRGGFINVEFYVGADRVVIEARADFVDSEPILDAASIDRFDSMVRTLVDDYDVDPDRGRVRLAKTRRED